MRVTTDEGLDQLTDCIVFLTMTPHQHRLEDWRRAGTCEYNYWPLLQLCAQQGRSGTETTVRCFGGYSPRAVFTWNYYKCILLPYTQARPLWIWSLSYVFAFQCH